MGPIHMSPWAAVPSPKSSEAPEYIFEICASKQIPIYDRRGRQEGQIIQLGDRSGLAVADLVTSFLQYCKSVQGVL